MTAIIISRAGPLATLQDAGRFGMLAHGISASGPMDRGAFDRAAALLGSAGATAIECTRAGLAFSVEGSMRASVAGGEFQLAVNGDVRPWPSAIALANGDEVEITPGPSGNYGYVRFDCEMTVAPVLGSRSTNVTVGLGGFKGRALKPGDRIAFTGQGTSPSVADAEPPHGPIRVIWGIHADLFHPAVRRRFLEEPFAISPSLDRMGVRLVDGDGVFRDRQRLGLVSDAIVPGDIQILGDGTPIVLMRDHQPTGGYPRIATIVTADLDRFAQLRPAAEVRFQPVTPEHAR